MGAVTISRCHPYTNGSRSLVMPCSSIRAAAICSASAIGASTPASRMWASMSRAWASRRPTSLLALAGGISFMRRLTSTGNGSESA